MHHRPGRLTWTAPVCRANAIVPRRVRCFFEHVAHGNWWERAGWLLMVALLIGCLPWSVARAVRNGGSDFPEFYAAGQHILRSGARHPDTILHRYLPSADVAFVPLALLPMPVASAVWYVLNAASWCGLLTAIGRYLLPEAGGVTMRHAVLCAGLLTLPLALDGFCLGAFHVLMVWLMVEGLGRAARGQDAWGGALLGVAVWVKLLPILGVGYLALKRKWPAAATAVLVATLIDAGLSVSAFGVQGALEAHHHWWRQDAQGAVQRQLQNPSAINEDRITNQSLAIVLRRTLSTQGQVVDHPGVRPQLAALTASQLTVTFMIINAALGAVVLYLLRRPGSALALPAWSAEISLVLLCTIWFSPVVWSYHPTAATPALAIVLWEKRYCWPAWLIAALWLLSMALFAVPAVRVCGQMLWMSLLLGALLAAYRWRPRHARMPMDPMPSSTKLGGSATGLWTKV